MSGYPRIGVGVFCWRDGRFLAQQRGRGCGKGMWSVPGGALEYGETFEQAAAREVAEETGLAVSGLRVMAVTNDMHASEGCGDHWVTVWLETYEVSGEPIATAEAPVFRWSSWDDLPQPLWQPHWDNLRVALTGGFPVALAALGKEPG